jgi:hypothetical protein
VCPTGRSFMGGVDGKPGIEVLALVRCVKYFYGMRGILLVETVIIYKCVKNNVTCTR